MKYACLVYMEDSVIGRLSPAELQKLDRESLANDRELERKGHLVAAQALQGVETATSVRVRDGKLSATDGPFAETKEHLGGFLLIEARDLNEVIRLMADLPLVKLGATIEVRPIYDLAAAVAKTAG
jgi:hypothetical protein